MSKTARYFDLTIPAPVRLMLLRRDFTEHPTKYPRCPESFKPKTWRDIRGTTHKSIAAHIGALAQGFNGPDSDANKTPIWYCHTGEQFRNERFADDCDGGPDHTGWFTDVHHDGKARGIVGRLTHGRFIAGYHWSDNGERVYFPEVFHEEEDAARMADEHARVFGESCMDDSQKQEEARELGEKVETDMQRLRECIALRNKACMHYVREEIADLLESIREKRDTLRTDYANYV